jgi:hypothetical protein
MTAILAATASTIPSLPGTSTVPSLPFSSGGGVSQAPVYSSPSTGIFGVTSVLTILADLLAVVALLGIVGVLVIVVVANRAEPDPSGRRPQAVYFFAVSFLTIIVSVIGSTVVVSSLTRLIGSHPSPIGNSVARIVVLGGLITLVGLLLLVTHLRRGVDLAAADSAQSNPSRRVGQSYVASITFLMVFVLLVVTVLGIYLLFAIAAPGVFGSLGGRTAATRLLIDTVFLAVVAGAVILTHKSLVPPGLHWFRHNGGADGLSGPPSSTSISFGPPQQPPL